MSEQEMIRTALLHYADAFVKESKQRQWAGTGWIPWRASLRQRAAEYRELAGKFRAGHHACMLCELICPRCGNTAHPGKKCEDSNAVNP